MVTAQNAIKKTHPATLKEPSMFKHIIVPVDGSATSLAAIDKAGALARALAPR